MVGRPDEITRYVGGVAQDRTRPYGYVVTWSIEDLLEEYVRPARVVREGRPASLPPFADLDRVQVPGVGEMESFLSDGLRTLIATMPDVRTMSERTLRWPGHAVAVRPLVESGLFLEEFHDKCVANPPRDLVAMMTVVKRGQQVPWRAETAGAGGDFHGCPVHLVRRHQEPQSLLAGERAAHEHRRADHARVRRRLGRGGVEDARRPDRGPLQPIRRPARERYAHGGVQQHRADHRPAARREPA